ncbi:MAG: Hsp20/alpha crystallin family protein [Bdellovibrionota bacterium]
MEQKQMTTQNGQRAEIQYFRPDVDIYDSENELIFVADLPGSSPEGMHVDFENGKLSIRAEAAPRTPQDVKMLVREYSVADFHRTFEINEAVDADNAKAEYRDGVLTLRLPKARANAKKIPVQ